MRTPLAAREGEFDQIGKTFPGNPLGRKGYRRKGNKIRGDGRGGPEMYGAERKGDPHRNPHAAIPRILPASRRRRAAPRGDIREIPGGPPGNRPRAMADLPVSAPFRIPI